MIDRSLLKFTSGITHEMRLNLSLALSSFLLCACIDDFTGEDLANFLPLGGQKTPLVAEREFLVCALAVFEAPPDFSGHSPDWQQLPLKDKVHETGLQIRALYNAEECWSLEVVNLLDMPSPLHFENSASKGQFWSHGNVLIIYNQATDHFVAMEG